MTARSTDQRERVSDCLSPFHLPVRSWFNAVFETPTPPQVLGWPVIARGESTLVLAPTGTGKTLAAFLWCLDRLIFAPQRPQLSRCRVLYVSPLKALAVDIERNLRVPLDGIVRSAQSEGVSYRVPTIAVRTGDTPPAERARFQRAPADILITTPESLYLLLTSRARDALRSIDTIIIDEIHALAPTKRGAHLMLSVERLASRCQVPPQRIGLSATQRPLDEIARFLGGVESVTAQGGRASVSRAGGRGAARRDAEMADEIGDEFVTRGGSVRYRPIRIVDAGTNKRLALTIDVPIEDMARLDLSDRLPRQPAPDAGAHASMWSAIHPRLLELIRAHRSTLVFVNSRRLAERLAEALNELAGEMLARSHHGSIAPAQRLEIESLLKSGSLRALVATSSLELGVDMGAIDLVVQIEAPPSVASGLQRIGRGGHRVGAISEGVIVPKFRGDLLACAAVVKAMREGAVEATHYPRNPLDIVAQQIVAMVSMDEWDVDELFATIRRAAPFAEMNRTVFEGVLDMLSGRYPSDDFAELRPRITWNRLTGMLTPREGAKRVAIANGGTIPDRGLYGVFLVGGSRVGSPGQRSARVGELDEEMVFESRVGEIFVLGASSWRIEGITHDRVLVSPAPGEPGKMPFWKGDRAGRPFELGLAIGRLTHDLMKLPRGLALERLRRTHNLNERAAENVLQYLRDELAAAGSVPDAHTIVVERVRDELGDWRICVLSPRGGRVHAPWAMAAAATIRAARGIDVQTLWGDDGFVVRFPDVDQPPDPQWLLPDPDDVQTLVVQQLGATALFAAKFRENAARALLLPKRRPGMRAPLWQQRKRAADLLAVASRHGSFPILLETYRECLRDYFDMPSLMTTLAEVRSRRIRVSTVDLETPSPFAASLLFSYVASFLYDGDAPLAERRAQALAVDQTQLRELLGDSEFRDLLDAESIEAVERRLQRLDPLYHAKSADGVHDLLLSLGDLTTDEMHDRTMSADCPAWLETLIAAGRVINLTVAGERRWAAVEDAARYRDALGLPLPAGIPDALLQPLRDPIGDLALRYARTHAPFTADDFSKRYGLGIAAADPVLLRLSSEGRLSDGQFRPGGTHREWSHPDVLRMVRRRSLAKLRHEVEPVEQAVLGRFAVTWQGIVQPRSGADALLEVIAQLQGAPLPASILETEILSARLDGYQPADLDRVTAAGEVVWIGVERLGERDGRLSLYLAAELPVLLPTPASTATPVPDSRESKVVEYLRMHGASFFGALHEAAGGGYPDETVDALWSLAWKGLVTNDTVQAMRALTRGHPAARAPRHGERPAVGSRRVAPPEAEGRWALARPAHARNVSRTKWATSLAQQLLTRYGILTREAVLNEAVPGGFGALYPVLKAMEEKGQVRRGYFVAGLGATQFALPGAVDLMRSLREMPDDTELAVLSATDPGNPYGAMLKWPRSATTVAGRGPTRTIGSTVVLVNGALVAYLARGDRQLHVFLPEVEPQRSRAGRAIARALIERARAGDDAPRGMLIEEIDGQPPSTHPFSPYLVEAGFLSGAMGLHPTFSK